MQGSVSSASTPFGASPRTGDRRIVLVAIFLGLLAAGLLLLYLRGVEARVQPVVPTVPVVVAREDLAAGTRITPAMVELRPLPETAVGRDAITSIDQAAERLVRYPISRGEPVGSLRLVDAPAVRALSFQIPVGMRAFTIPINQTKSPAGLMAPGDFVDVLAILDLSGAQAPVGPATVTFGDPREPQAAVTLLQNVQVLAVQRAQIEGVPYDASARGTPPRDGNISNLTLAVTPEQVQMLTLAVDTAKYITVALRPFGDTETRPLGPFVGPVQLPGQTDPTTTSPSAPRG